MKGRHVFIICLLETILLLRPHPLQEIKRKISVYDESLKKNLHVIISKGVSYSSHRHLDHKTQLSFQSSAHCCYLLYWSIIILFEVSLHSSISAKPLFISLTLFIRMGLHEVSFVCWNNSSDFGCKTTYTYWLLVTTNRLLITTNRLLIYCYSLSFQTC